MKKSKLLALLLAVMLLVSVMPPFAVADGAAGSIVVEQSINDAKDLITLESYVTAPSVPPAEKVAAPADIVLVLDQSKSMNDKYDKQGSRQDALKKAVVSFVEQVGEAYSADANHKLAVVTFNNKVSTAIGWTAADEAGVAADGLRQELEPRIRRSTFH